MIYTLTLNPALDYVLAADTLCFGEINRATSAVFRFGGKGLNVSAMLARLDVPSVALGFAAGSTGKKLIELAKEAGVKCDLTELRHGETRVNVKLRSTNELDVNAPGPAISDTDLDALVAKLSALADGDTLVLSGSVPKTAPPDAYDRILASVADRRVDCVVDTSGDTLRSALAHRPFLIKPNHVELGELFGEKADAAEKIAALAARLREAGARNVLVSRAERGAMLFTESGEAYSVGVVRKELVDSACCGDAMVAGFLAGYARALDFADALRLGAACGNATAFCDGLADADAAREIYDKLTMTKISF